MKTVLLTGVEGFTGRHLVQYLTTRGHKCLSLDVDIRNRESTQKAVSDLADEHSIDAVIHLAAISFVQHDDASEIYQVNVIGTENLLCAIEKAHITPRVILASSANVYGIPPDSQPLEESQCSAPNNHYACSKLAMEMMAKTFQHKFSIIVVRPFNYTGINQDKKFLVPKIADHFVRRSTVIELGNLEICRDFSSIDDVCEVYENLLHLNNASFEVVNIASSHLVSIQEIISFCEAETGHKIRINQNHALVRNADIPAMCGSSVKLNRLINFTPKKENFWITLKRMLKA